MSEFDIKAAEWDKNQMHWDRSAAIAREIRNSIPLKPWFRAMEFGAGTGILSFILKDDVMEIVLIDNSTEMIRQADEKIRTSGVENLKTMVFDLEHSELNNTKFDFIFTQMVLHHVSDVDTILNQFSRLLNHGGYIAIADLYEEDGSFHGEGFTGHKGFSPDKLSSILEGLKFNDILHKKCFVINRKTEEGIVKNFDVFLLTAVIN